MCSSYWIWTLGSGCVSACKAGVWLQYSVNGWLLFHMGTLYLQHANSNRQRDAGGAERTFALRNRPRVSLELPKQICQIHIDLMHRLKKPERRPKVHFTGKLLEDHHECLFIPEVKWRQVWCGSSPLYLHGTEASWGAGGRPCPGAVGFAKPSISLDTHKKGKRWAWTNSWCVIASYLHRIR